jgi:signal peptidase
VLGSWLATLVLILIVAALGLGAWGVRTGDWQAHPVLSGSMEPVLPTGSIAIMHKTPTSELRVGDVITFREPAHQEILITHRIVSITDENGRRVYETKGDANGVKDPWEVTLRGEVSYRLHQSVPYVGYAVAWLRQPDSRTWTYGAAALIGLWAVVQLFLPDRTSRRDEGRTSSSSPVAELTYPEVKP